MHKSKTKLLYNEEEFRCTKTKLLNFKINRLFPKLDTTVAKLESNSLIFFWDIHVNIQLVTFYCYYAMLVN